MPVVYRRRHSRRTILHTIKICGIIALLSLIGGSITILLTNVFSYTSTVTIDRMVSSQKDAMIKEALQKYHTAEP